MYNDRQPNLRLRIFILFLAINLVNNLDRQVLALVAPALQKEFAWGDLHYARVVAAFQISFSLMNLISGRFVDWIGVRIGTTLAIFWFSILQIAHVFARGATSFGIARIGLAMGEAPVYPATLKGIAEWAPQKERGSAAGLVHFGVMLGAIVAPLGVPFLTAHWGWRSAFIITGVLGLLLVIPSLRIYSSPESHKKISPEERALILQDRRAVAPSESFSWWRLFTYRQVWAYVMLQAIVNPAWWFVVYWLPKFLGENFNIRGVAITPYVTTVYCIAAVGAIVGGGISGRLLGRGLSLNKARKFTLLGCGLVMPVVIVAAFTQSPWLAICVIGIAALVHQTWTATGSALLADLIPTKMIASVVGIASFVGSIAGVIGAELTGRVLQAHPGAYMPMFLYAGSAYLLATIVIHLLTPRMAPLHIGGDAEQQESHRAHVTGPGQEKAQEQVTVLDRVGRNQKEA